MVTAVVAIRMGVIALIVAWNITMAEVSVDVIFTGLVWLCFFFVLLFLVLIGVVSGSVVICCLVRGWMVDSNVMLHNLISSVVVARRKLISWDTVFHLASNEDLREGKTDRVTKFIEVLILPLSFSVHDLVVNILAIDDQIMLDMENEVPRVSEGLGHFTELVEVSTNCSFAFFELISNVMNDATQVFNTLKD